MNTKSIDKEVLEITPGEWIIIEGDNRGRVSIAPKESFGFIGSITSDGYGVAAKDNAKAICKAINGTYGKGYNPAAMDELVKTLGEFVDYINSTWLNTENMPDGFKDLLPKAETTLKNAKL